MFPKPPQYFHTILCEENRLGLQAYDLSDNMALWSKVTEWGGKDTGVLPWFLVVEWSTRVSFRPREALRNKTPLGPHRSNSSRRFRQVSSDNLQICYKINAPGYNTVCRWRQTHSFILSVNNREQHGTHAQLAIGNGYQNNVTWLRLFYGMTFFSAQRIKIQHRQIYDIDSLAYLIQRASP